MRLKRYKMFVVEFNCRSFGRYAVDILDGIHWASLKALSGELYGRCAILAYYDPFRGKYVLSLKTIGKKYRRSRCFLAHEDPEMLGKSGA